MEGQEGINNSYGVTPKREEAPEIHRPPATENPNQLTGSAPPSAATEATPVSAAAAGTAGKKKRGRPRKYAPDGTPLALSPMPISASIPLTGNFSAWKQGRGRPLDSFKKKHKLLFETPGKFTLLLAYMNLEFLWVYVNGSVDLLLHLNQYLLCQLLMVQILEVYWLCETRSSDLVLLHVLL